MNGIVIRELSSSEKPILKEMVYEAIYLPDDAKRLPKEVVKIPEITAYIKNFGKKKDDYCLVAELNDKIIGAIWVRVIGGKTKGYGYVDNQTPEFAMALFKDYRGQGFGTLMLQHMIEYLKSAGYKQASLSVDKENFAVKIYKKFGFEIINENENDYLMIIKLQ